MYVIKLTFSISEKIDYSPHSIEKTGLLSKNEMNTTSKNLK